jgi:hypothetical protein
MIDLKARLLKKQAAGYSRLMQIMNAKVPTVYTFGIMSVDNPQGRPVSPEENNKARQQFREALKHSLLGYVEHKGVFEGVAEASFFIMNVSKKAMFNWQKSFDQNSVIFGTVDQENGRVIFEYIEHGVTISTREVVMTPGEHELGHSLYKGRKFLIPFFDDSDSKISSSNLPAGIPLTKEAALRSKENHQLVATIEAENEHIRLIALGERVGMGNMAHRGRMIEALRKLKVD